LRTFFIVFISSFYATFHPQEPTLRSKDATHFTILPQAP